jgi:two-component system sensor histidine kinase SenX3
MGRYNLPEDKRKQIAEMINSESKRLARMIQTFLDVEKLSEGQVELKKDRFGAGEIVETCLARVAPVAERKRIALRQEGVAEALVTGDRELMEYAVYNLLTNAIKYSPAETTVRVSGAFDGAALRLAVADQGIGMDQKELKKIFTKFYRTRKAEASGEAGTGIGLSIVEQIVAHHGGRIEVFSRPGEGSCFTLVLPATAPTVQNS